MQTHCPFKVKFIHCAMLNPLILIASLFLLLGKLKGDKLQRGVGKLDC